MAGGLLHNASLLKIMKIRENPFKPPQIQLNCWGGGVIYIFPPLQAVVYSEGFTLLTLHLSLVVSLGRDPRKIRRPRYFKRAVPRFLWVSSAFLQEDARGLQGQRIGTRPPRKAPIPLHSLSG